MFLQKGNKKKAMMFLIRKGLVYSLCLSLVCFGFPAAAPAQPVQQPWQQGFNDAFQCYTTNGFGYCVRFRTDQTADQGCMDQYTAGYNAGLIERERKMQTAFQQGQADRANCVNNAFNQSPNDSCRTDWIKAYNSGYFPEPKECRDQRLKRTKEQAEVPQQLTPAPTPAGPTPSASIPPPKPEPSGSDAALLGGIVALGAIGVGAAVAAGGGLGGSGGGGSSGGSSSSCRCSSGSYYCSGSWGSACCSYRTCSSPYYASNGMCYCSIFSMPSNVRYVMCGGCKERTE